MGLQLHQFPSSLSMTGLGAPLSSSLLKGAI